MAVTSTPTARPEPQVIRKSGYEPGAIIGALVGFTFGAVSWIFGARYTIDGVIHACNLILEFLTIPTRIAMRWELYLGLAIIPIAFSAVEWTCSPVGRNRVKHPGLIAAWFIAITLDIGSTLLGLSAAKSPALLVAIVGSSLGIGILSIILTFAPEALMKSCGKLLGRAIRSLFT